MKFGLTLRRDPEKARKQKEAQKKLKNIKLMVRCAALRCAEFV